MTPTPIYSFTDTTSTGIDTVPINSIILVASTGQQIQLIDKTGVTSATTISTLLATPALYIKDSTYWHSGNDGTGSGLDADLLDGLDSTAFELAFSKNTGFNKSLGTTAGTVAEGNDTRIVNGATAFTWGDHSTAGYLTNITSQSIENLSDVNTMVPTDGQVLTWDNVNSRWDAATPAGGASFDGLTSKTSGTGNYSTSGFLTAGRGSGGVALTVNDGQGNANVTFNHESGSAEQAGNVGRITVNTDATTAATMIFSGKSNAATGAVTDATMATMYADSGDFTAVGNVTAYSDKRLKTDIAVIDNAIEKVMQLSGYTYTRTDTEIRQAGVIAQEVQEVLPEVVNEDADGILNVAYGNMVGLLIEAIKDLKKEIEELKAK